MKITNLNLKQILTLPGRHEVGNGLWLKVMPKGAYWVYRYRVDNVAREASLGSARKVTLTEARKQHTIMRGQVAAGVDHDHIARRGDIQRLVHHQIVRRPAVHRNGEAAQRQPRARRDARVHEAEAPHRVGEVGAGLAGEALQQVVCDARRRRQHAESDRSRLRHAQIIAALTAVPEAASLAPGASISVSESGRGIES